MSDGARKRAVNEADEGRGKENGLDPEMEEVDPKQECLSGRTNK